MDVKLKEHQKYDAWLQWTVSSKCNFECAYCFPKARVRLLSVKRLLEFHFMKEILLSIPKKGIPALKNVFHLLTSTDKDDVVPIDIPGLMKTLKETGKTFRIGFTGGEPFLIPNLVEACAEITKQHYVSINTNLVIGKRIEHFAKTIDPGRVIFIIGSVHIEELERTRLLRPFISNFRLLADRGFPVRAEAVAYPKLLPDVERIKRIFRDAGIPIYFCPYIGLYGAKRYPAAYTASELEAFGMVSSAVEIYKPKGKFCNAGHNAAVVMSNGNILPCYQRVNEPLGSIYEQVRFMEGAAVCQFSDCACPLYAYDSHLFKKSIGLHASSGSLQEPLKTLPLPGNLPVSEPI